MSYIAPNSTVWLYKGVPLDPNYENTYWFASKAAQKSAFDTSYLAYTFTAQSYCRATGSAIRIQRNPDDLINCNYMAFRNTSFGDKIFYAFIDDVAYINNSTAEIRFTIDVLQTYFRDVTFMPSYIEREHSATDKIGANIVPEPTNTSGTITYQDEQRVPYQIAFSGKNVGALTVMLCNKDFKTTANAGVFTPEITYQPFSVNGVTQFGVPYLIVIEGGRGAQAYDKIQSYIKNGGQILSLYCIPAECVTLFEFDSIGSEFDFLGVFKGGTANPIVPYMEKPTPGKSLNGYIPKNNKIYTFPYCFLRVVTGSGDKRDYEFEFMSGERAEFVMATSLYTDEQTEVLIPNTYLGIGSTSAVINGIKYSDFPAPALSTTEYAQIRGQERLGYVINGLKSYLGQSLGGSSSQPSYTSKEPLTNAQSIYISDAGKAKTAIGTGARALSAGISQAATQDAMMNNTVTIPGKGGSCWLNMFADVPHFTLYTCCMNRAALARYDNYFTRFGYASNTVKFPNFIQGKGRKTFNYIKMNGASIVAKDAPADAIQKMKQIFDSGTTVWLQLGNVGNFGLSNDPIE